MTTTAASTIESREKRPGPPTAAAAPAPSKPRRNIRMLLLGVVLALLCGLAAVWAVNRAGTPTSVVILTNDVAAGQQVTGQDLGTTNITGGEGLNTVPKSQMRSLVGQRASKDLSAGSLASEGAFQSRVAPRDGDVIVGVPLTSGQYPQTGLAHGDVVRLVLGKADSAGKESAEQTSVSAVVLSVGEPDKNSRIVVDFSVPNGDADQTARAASSEQVTVVNVAPGGTGSSGD